MPPHTPAAKLQMLYEKATKIEVVEWQTALRKNVESKLLNIQETQKWK